MTICSITPCFYTIYQIRVYIRVIQINEVICPEIILALNIMPIPFETLFLTYVICGIHVILLSIITPRYFISFVAVIIESPITKFDE